MVIAAGVAVSAIVSCSSPITQRSAASAFEVPQPLITDARPRSYEGVHNVVAFHEDFYSGSAPEGEAGFETLHEMGIKTIVSVDGAAPNLNAAKRYGMRYIHLPIGYNGFEEARKLELVRATRDAIVRGGVYIHCHHGKHRSACAAASVAQSLGWMTAQEGQARMKVSGTAMNYTGLYQCAAASAVLVANVIDAVSAEFPEIQPPKGLVKSMVEIDEVTEHLKAIEAAGWNVPPDQPDLVATAEAGRLADLFRQLQTNERVARKSEDFMEKLKADEARAQKLEAMLAAGEKDGKRLSVQLGVIIASCMECHTKYRD